MFYTSKIVEYFFLKNSPPKPTLLIFIYPNIILA